MSRLLLLPAALIASISPVAAQSGTPRSPAWFRKTRRSHRPALHRRPQARPPEDWHSYYQNSGGVELPPAIVWKLPDGFTAGPIQWPVPEVKDGFFGKSFVYHGSPVFLIEISPPNSLASRRKRHPDRRRLLADLQGKLHQRVQVLHPDPPRRRHREKDPAQAELFANARKNLPVRDATLEITAHSDGGDVQLRIANLKGTPTDFIPNQPFLQPASAGGSHPARW